MKPTVEGYLHGYTVPVRVALIPSRTKPRPTSRESVQVDRCHPKPPGNQTSLNLITFLAKNTKLNGDCCLCSQYRMLKPHKVIGP